MSDWKKFLNRGIPTIGVIVAASLLASQFTQLKYVKNDVQRVTKGEMQRHIDSVRKSGIEETLEVCSFFSFLNKKKY